MEKDNAYWSLHKETYNKMIQELDTDIVRKIYGNPNCNEGRLFQRRVDKATEEKVNLLLTK